MIRAKVEPMPGNPAADRVGVSTGLWKVVIYDYGDGSVIDPNTPGHTHTENLTFEEARDLAADLERQLNKRD
jgi:hypothetical protein